MHPLDGRPGERRDQDLQRLMDVTRCANIWRGQPERVQRDCCELSSLSLILLALTELATALQSCPGIRPLDVSRGAPVTITPTLTSSECARSVGVGPDCSGKEIL